MNCIIVDDEEMSRNALKHLIQQIDFLKLVKICEGPAEAAIAIKNEKPDLLFLDIEMPGMSGLELLKSLEVRPLTILTTSHKEYALDAFDHNVIDYLVKPVQLPRFLQSVTKAKEFFDNSKSKLDGAEKDYFFIKTNSVMNKVLIKDILWIEAMGDYVTINTAAKKLILHLTLKAIEEKLPSDKFVRVHRSFMVALDNIAAIEDTTICIANKLIPVGAIYKENFMKRLNLLT
jgi:two-component system, LytTR family, response regulator